MHSNNRKWVAISGALLVSCVLSSCEMPHTLSAYLGDERTLPDTANVNFSQPRRPILNPLNNYPSESTSERRLPISGNKESSMNSNSTRSTLVSSNGRRVPAENMAMFSGNNAAPGMTAKATPPSTTAMFEKALAAPATPAAAPALTQPSAESTTTASAAAAPQDGFKDVTEDWTKPVEAASNTAPAAVPAQPLKLIPPSASAPAPAEVIAAAPPVAAAAETAPKSDAKLIAEAAAKAEAPKAAKPALTADGLPMPRAAAEAVAQEESKENANKAPALATVPEAPKRTPVAQINRDVKTLTAEREATQAAGQMLKADPSSTVMTNAETGKLVPGAAKAVPSPESEKELDTLINAKEPKASQATEVKPAVAVAAPTATEEEHKEKDEKPAAEAAPAAAQPSASITAPVAAAETASAKPAEKPAASPIELASVVTAPVRPEIAAMAQMAPAAGTAPVTLIPPSAPKLEEKAAAPAAPVVATPAAPKMQTATSEVVQVQATPGIAGTDAKKELTNVIADDNADEEKKPRYLPDPRYTAKRHLTPVSEAY